MMVSKLHLSLAAALGIALTVGWLWQVRENRKLEGAMERVSVSTTRSASTLRAQLALQSQRLTEADTTVTGLLKQAQKVTADHTRSVPPSGPISAQDAVEAAMVRGAQLIKEGRFREALDGYLECYRELHAMRPGSPESQRLMAAMKNLGRTYPAALWALGELRDAAMRQMQAQSGVSELPFEIALLNESLGEARRTLVVFDALAAGDPRRQTVAMVARDSFVEARRYEDAFLGKPFAFMLGWIEGGSNELTKVDAQRQAGLRKSVIEGTLTNIEVVTGAGRADDARRLTEKLLAFDNSETTQTQLKQHLERATQARSK